MSEMKTNPFLNQPPFGKIYSKRPPTITPPLVPQAKLMVQELEEVTQSEELTVNDDAYIGGKLKQAYVGQQKTPLVVENPVVNTSFSQKIGMRFNKSDTSGGVVGSPKKVSKSADFLRNLADENTLTSIAEYLDTCEQTLTEQNYVDLGGFTKSLGAGSKIVKEVSRTMKAVNLVKDTLKNPNLTALQRSQALLGPMQLLAGQTADLFEGMQLEHESLALNGAKEGMEKLDNFINVGMNFVADSKDVMQSMAGVKQLMDKDKRSVEDVITAALSIAKNVEAMLDSGDKLVDNIDVEASKDVKEIIRESKDGLRITNEVLDVVDSTNKTVQSMKEIQQAMTGGEKSGRDVLKAAYSLTKNLENTMNKSANLARSADDEWREIADVLLAEGKSGVAFSNEILGIVDESYKTLDSMKKLKAVFTAKEKSPRMILEAALDVSKNVESIFGKGQNLLDANDHEMSKFAVELLGDTTSAIETAQDLAEIVNHSKNMMSSIMELKSVLTAKNKTPAEMTSAALKLTKSVSDLLNPGLKILNEDDAEWTNLVKDLLGDGENVLHQSEEILAIATNARALFNKNLPLLERFNAFGNSLEKSANLAKDAADGLKKYFDDGEIQNTLTELAAGSEGVMELGKDILGATMCVTNVMSAVKTLKSDDKNFFEKAKAVGRGVEHGAKLVGQGADILASDGAAELAATVGVEGFNKVSEVASKVSSSAKMISAAGALGTQIAGKGLAAMASLKTLRDENATIEDKVHAASVAAKIAAESLKMAGTFMSSSAGTGLIKRVGLRLGSRVSKFIPILGLATDVAATWVATKKAIRVLKSPRATKAQKAWAVAYVATQVAGMFGPVGDGIALAGDLVDQSFFGGKDTKDMYISKPPSK